MDKEILINTYDQTKISKQEEINVTSCTLQELLCCNVTALTNIDQIGQITIPEYQRPYVWKEKQINRLLNDFIEYKNNKDDKALYYLGSIIIHKEGDKLNIIDGQQRLTTMLLLNSFLEEPIVSNVSYKSPLSVANIKRNHSYLQKVFQNEFLQFQSISTSDIIDFKSINITLIITSSEDLAYTFFETQNTGGVRLSGSDIIKSHHLRAIKSKRIIAHQAMKWESFASSKIENAIEQLGKIRYWNNSYWRQFPFYRDEKGLKDIVIEEFSEKTSKEDNDTSHYFMTLKKENGKVIQFLESDYRQIRQPLYDGNNFMDYIYEYVELFEILFSKKDDYRVPEAFYEFQKKLLHGHDGTLFLKELFEITLVTYVSRFGFSRLYEVSLWLYRYVYSLRVSFNRNVREDSIFKFVNEKKLIDKILLSYTVDGLLKSLKSFSYSFDPNNTEIKQSKGKHVNSLKAYFNNFTTAQEMCENNLFDKVLIQSIDNKIASYES